MNLVNLNEIFWKVIEQRHIVRSMVIKNLKDKYVGSFLGIFWAVINPILIMVVITFVFTKIVNSGIKNFPLFVLSGLLPWFFFINSISESVDSIKQNADILKQFIIPREIIPISVVIANFVNFLLGFVVILPIFILFNREISRYLCFLPLIAILHFSFTLGLSMLFSIVNIYIKDLSQLLNVGIMFWFWVTPVFYSLEMVPDNYRWIILINPATCFIVIYRKIIYYGVFCTAYMWLSAFVLALISIVIGYSLFIKKESEILKRI